MALLGIQFVVSLIVALIIQKLSPFYSLARWIMCSGLYRYLHPTNEELKKLAGKPNIPTKGKRRKGIEKKIEQNGHIETFTIPCNLEISLEKAKIQEIDLYTQYKYQDYKWLVDLSFCALIVYLLIELAAKWRPQVFSEEFNIGFVWCCLVVFFAIKELYLLTAAYWKSDDGGERGMTISFGFFFFVMAMGILVIDESVLDFGLETGYKDFSQNLEFVYKTVNFSLKRAPSIWAFKVVLAFFSAFLGAILGFPGIRYANMHLDSIFFLQGKSFILAALNLMFFSPFFLLLLWILPLSRELLYVKRGKGPEKLLTDEAFLYLRIHLLIAGCVLRLLISRKLLQSHLNTASQKVRKLKKETGRITNLELQRTVARVFYYLSAAALQYIAPLILMLFLGLMLRTLTYNMSSENSLARAAGAASNSTVNNQKKDYSKLIRSLFSVKMVYGTCSYVTWWSLVTYCMTSCFGMVYLKYLA